MDAKGWKNMEKGNVLSGMAVVHSTGFVVAIGLAIRVNNWEPRLHCEVDGTA
jgi:hypothetical protein